MQSNIKQQNFLGQPLLFSNSLKRERRKEKEKEKKKEKSKKE